jgi:lipopolysaccharide transport system ATP-binding protein
LPTSSDASRSGDLAVRARGLSKQFRITGWEAPYKTLRESMANLATAPFRMLRRSAWRKPERPKVETFWALRDVGFEVRGGEVIGIIGRNGAGKSTLLKILSRITEPTEGFAEIRGRVSSLLEVGIGFHGELTGRENLYLNGAILGMRKNEIDRKFDEIVAFAEVERFIDTPVKHYSSGMYLRLAFAVAAHLEPEILIVDEVLAVGDAAFQRKCLNKMEDVGHQGRTVLFVSHNMPAVTRLCQRVLLLNQGRVLEDGPAARVVGAYLRSGLGTSAAREWDRAAPRPAGEIGGLLAVRVRSTEGSVIDAVDIRRPFGVEIEWDVGKPGYRLMPHLQFTNEEGVVAFSAHEMDPEWRGRVRPPGRYISTAWIPGNLLAEGTMVVAAGLVTLDPVIDQFFERDVVAFQVVDSLDGDSARGDMADYMAGVLRPMLRWSTDALLDEADTASGIAGGGS